MGIVYIGEGQSSSASLSTCLLALPISLFGSFDFTVFYIDFSPMVHPTHTPLVLGRVRLSAFGTLSRGLRTLDCSAARLGRGTWMYQGLIGCISILLLTFCFWAIYAITQRLWSQMAKARGFREPPCDGVRGDSTPAMSVLIAAFTSRSWTAPHAEHVHCLTDKPA